MGVLTESQILSSGRLQQWQVECLLSKARVRILATSRQIGKSLTLRTICLKEMLENPGIEILYLAPTIKQVKAIGFRPLVTSNDSIIPKELIKNINKTDLTVELTNGSRIVFAGTESVDKLRGMTCDLLLLDEYAFMEADVLTSLNAMLDARNGRLVIASTPKGRNHFYEICQKGILNNHEFTKGFRTWIIPIDHPHVNVPNIEMRIENAKKTLSIDTYEQEYRVSFTTASGLVYKQYSLDESVSNIELDVKLGLYVGIDFNVAKMVAVIGQKHKVNNVEQLHIKDEIVLYDTNTDAMAKEILRKYPDFKGRITVVPDASGSSRKTSAKDTDHAILRHNGLRVDTPNANPEIDARINAVNTLFKTVSGNRRLFINNKCNELIKALTSQSFDKNGKPEKGTGRTDISAAPDALGYLVNRLYPINTANSTIYNTHGR